jgi:hypothetical protein
MFDAAVIYLLVLFVQAQPLNSTPARTREHNPKNLTVSLVFFMFLNLVIGCSKRFPNRFIVPGGACLTFLATRTPSSLPVLTEAGLVGAGPIGNVLI